MTLNFGHRGLSGRYPENTMLAFEKAIEAGCDGIELDVHLSADGELVIIHDELVDRTADGTGYVGMMTLKELRTNPESYNGAKVAFNGVITRNYNNSVYVEALDPETGMYNGISVYYGYALPGAALDILSVGNEVRIVGLMQFYEAGGTWQISGLTHNLMKPQDPGNCQKLSEGNKPAYVLTDAETFVSGKVTLENGEERDYAQMALGSSLAMQGLTVESIYTTEDEESSSKGAMTLTCKVGDTTVLVRTIVLKDANGEIITADEYQGKTIDVKGIVDFFNGTYQIKVFSANDITIHN